MTKIFFHCDILDFLLIILYFYVQIMFTDIIPDHTDAWLVNFRRWSSIPDVQF